MINPSKYKSKLFSEGTESDILITENNSRQLGVGLARYLRIFIFEAKSHNVSIDFVNQLVTPNGMSIVPPGHINAIGADNTSNFICIEINPKLLREEDIRLLLALKYLKQKQLKEIESDIIHYNLLKTFIGVNFNEQAFFELLRNSIIARIKFQFGGLIEANSKYLKLAEHFLHLVNTPKPFTVNHTSISKYTEELKCSEKALLRCCLSVFNLSPQELLKHHLFINALGLISTIEKPAHSIAERLGYSSQSAFSKFMKSQTSQRLNYIRQQIKERVKG